MKSLENIRRKFQVRLSRVENRLVVKIPVAPIVPTAEIQVTHDLSASFQERIRHLEAALEEKAAQENTLRQEIDALKAKLDESARRSVRDREKFLEKIKQYDDVIRDLEEQNSQKENFLRDMQQSTVTLMNSVMKDQKAAAAPKAAIPEPQAAPPPPAPPSAAPIVEPKIEKFITFLNQPQTPEA